MATANLSLNNIPAPQDEVEEDIANNNDPNNNAVNVDANDSVLNEESPDVEPEGSIDDEVDNILNLLPDTGRDEVRQRLKKHWSSLSRKEVS